MRKTVMYGVAALMLWGSAGVSAGGFYLGVTTGIMDADIKGFDEAVNAGLLVGYDVLKRDIFALSVEGELTTTVSDGDVEFSGREGDWDIDTQAAYLAARLGERVYLKVRYGIVRNDVSVRVAGNSSSESDTSGSWGGALGWMFSDHWGVQADGTLVDSDITYWNLGVQYRF